MSSKCGENKRRTNEISYSATGKYWVVPLGKKIKL